jgi:hypothetical protein
VTGRTEVSVERKRRIGKVPGSRRTDMRNTECIVRLTTSGGAVQTWHRDDRGWIETSSRGIERRATAEQLLSHLLPALERGYPKVSVEKR